MSKGGEVFCDSQSRIRIQGKSPQDQDLNSLQRKTSLATREWDSSGSSKLACHWSCSRNKTTWFAPKEYWATLRSAQPIEQPPERWPCLMVFFKGRCRAHLAYPCIHPAIQPSTCSVIIVIKILSEFSWGTPSSQCPWHWLSPCVLPPW